MKNILAICSNPIVALQMKIHSKNNLSKYNYHFIIEDNIFKKEVLNILDKIKYKKIFINNFSKRPIYFALRKLYEFNKIKTYNSKIKKKILKTNFIKKILEKNFSEIWFSNDNFSKFFVSDFSCKKKYFAHATNDFLIYQKKFNIFYLTKNLVEDFINNKFCYIYKPSFYNTTVLSIFSSFLKNKNNNILSKEKFKNEFYKNLNVKINRKLLNKKINLINVTIPYAYYEQKYPQNVLNKYLNFFEKEILEKIIIKKKITYVLKFKDSIPFKLRKKIILRFKNKFKNYKILLFNNKITGTLSLEKFVCCYNVETYYSSFSSSIFLVRILKKTVKLVNFSKEITNYWNDKKKNLFYVHRKNLENYLKAYKFYRRIWLKLD